MPATGLSGKGRVVIVTGGASGIGAATCRLLAEQQFTPVVADLDETGGGALAGELDSLFVRHDVTDPASWTRLRDQVLERFGAMYGLVASAGLKSEYLLDGPLDPELFQRTAAVNQLGPILGIQVIGAVLRAQRSGSIVTISSGSGMPPSQSPDVAYVSTKWGARGVSRVAARDLAPFGVRVNTILPGLVRTPMVAGIVDEFPERVSTVEAAIPLGRIGDPIDIARAAYFLISDLAGYVTGAELVVDGGSLS